MPNQSLLLQKALPDFIKDKIKGKKKDDEKGKKKKAPLFGKKSALALVILEKAIGTTSRDGAHAHGLELPEVPTAGTFVTKPAKSPGTLEKHVHVAVVRPGSKVGQKIVTSPGIDGHTHTVVLGASGRLTRSAGKFDGDFTHRCEPWKVGDQFLTVPGPELLLLAADISPDNSAQVSGADSLRGESLEGAPKGRRGKRRKSVHTGRERMKAALAGGLSP